MNNIDIRNIFAGLAMHAMITRGKHIQELDSDIVSDKEKDYWAENAYLIAEAMIKRMEAAHANK